MENRQILYLWGIIKYLCTSAETQSLPLHPPNNKTTFKQKQVLSTVIYLHKQALKLD